MAGILLLSRDDVRGLVTLKQAITAVENAFSDFAEGKAVLPPAVGFPVEKHAGEMHIKGGYLPELDSIAIKIASSFSKNPKHNLPTVLATIFLHKAETGMLKAIMDGVYITTIRTAAAGAVAAKYLSKKDSNVVGVVGTGVQGRMQVEALSHVRKIEKVKAFSIEKESKEKYVNEMHAKFNFEVEATNSVEETVKDADILVTATPSHEPFVKEEFLHPGLHINAIGSDNPKKQELDVGVLKRVDKIVADRIEQCKVAGEIHHALEQNAITPKDIYAELGEITSGKKTGREKDDEITLFDSTGVAIQDIAVATLAYNLAKEKGIGKTVDI